MTRIRGVPKCRGASVFYAPGDESEQANWKITSMPYPRNRKSAIYRGSANRLWMPDANRPCVERLWIRDKSRIHGGGTVVSVNPRFIADLPIVFGCRTRIGRVLNGYGYAMNRGSAVC